MPLLSLFTNFPNRIGRAHWWLGVAVAAAIMFAAYALGGKHNALMMVVAALMSLAILIPVTIARLHDRNHGPGIAVTCFLGVLLIAKFIRHAVEPDYHGWAAAAVAIAFAAWAVTELGILRGTAGDNAYGPDPLARESRAEKASS